jgi:hypothetical protein
MVNDLIATGGPLRSEVEINREVLAPVRDPFAAPAPAILPEEAIDKELKEIATLRRTDRRAYDKDNALHKRELVLLSMKEQWIEANRQEHRWKVKAAQVLRTVPDAQGFEKSYDKLWANLDEAAKDVIRYELAAPVGEQVVRPASEAAVARFATSDIGEELVREWGGQARKKLAIVQARAERLLRTGDEAIEWFESLPAAQARAVVKVLAG